MFTLGWRSFVLCVSLLGLVSAWADEPNQQPPQNEQVEALIDRLTDVSELGFGYSSSISGNQFLPQADSEQMSMILLGQEKPQRSEVLEQLVRLGADAVPALLAHLDDARPTKIPPIQGRLGGLWFADEYDYNLRTTDQPPQLPERGLLDQDRPRTHQITVGDLCFVALGQILNRYWQATRYQPTAIIVINSPTYSQPLCNQVREDWKGMTAEKHRESLRQDFLKPDIEDRRIDAYRRLAFYYPVEVEDLVVRQLKVPSYQFSQVEEFVQQHLYAAATEARRRKLSEDFVKQHGPVARAGIVRYLLEDYALEIHPSAEEILRNVYGFQFNMKNQLALIDAWSDSEQETFIRFLVHDDSPRITQAIHEVWKQNPDHRLLAMSCLEALGDRGYNGPKAEMTAYVREQLQTDDDEWKESWEALLGWLEGKAKEDGSKKPAAQGNLAK